MHLLPLGLCWSEWLAFGATFGKNRFLGSLENRPTVVFFSQESLCCSSS